jgi:hypothetical protein
MSLPQLRELIQPPGKPQETGTPKKWEKFERRLGTPLPPDYKDFIDFYGTGTFNNLILPLNPFAENEYLNMMATLDAHHQANRRTQLAGDPAWTVVQPFGLYPAPNGLLPWGTTAAFELNLFWQVQGPPANWVTILYNLGTGEYEVWKLSATAFLSQLFLQQIESVLLPTGYNVGAEHSQWCQLENF